MTLHAELVDVAGARRRLMARLRDAHRLLRRRARRDGFDRGLTAAGSVLVLVAAIWLAWRLIANLLALPEAGLSWEMAALAAVVAAAGAALLEVLRARGARPTLAEAAERWDAAARTGNRIATAFDFTGRPAGPFEAAAILDGLAAAEAAGMDALARREAARRAPWRLPLLAGAAALLILAGALVPPRAWTGAQEPGPRPGMRHEARVAAPPAEAPGARAASPATRSERPPLRETGAPPPSDHRPEAAGSRSGTSSASGERQKAAGTPGRGKSVEARAARQASASLGEPTEGEAPAPLQDEKPASRRGDPKRPDATRLVKPQKKRDEKTGATAGTAGTGGGAMSPVRSAWTQRDRSMDDPLPENPSDEDIEDEIEEEEARGGTQPSLKDRRGATSRDLSISGPGEGGEGRGGPTPPKKARGTASLVLGVPVPDFVRGLLNPGTTKVTHEQVEPVPAPAEPRAPVPLARRDRREAVVEPASIPAGLGPVVRRFLVSWHSLATPDNPQGP